MTVSDFFFPSKSGDFGPFLPKKSIVEVALAFFLGAEWWKITKKQNTETEYSKRMTTSGTNVPVNFLVYEGSWP